MIWWGLILPYHYLISIWQMRFFSSFGIIFFFNDSILSLLCLVSYASLSWDFSGCLQFIFKISPTYCSLHSSDTMPHIAHKYFNCIIVSLWNLNYIWYLYDFIYVLIFMLHMHLIYILHYFYNIVYFSFYRSSFFFPHVGLPLSHLIRHLCWWWSLSAFIFLSLIEDIFHWIKVSQLSFLLLLII